MRVSRCSGGRNLDHSLCRFLSAAWMFAMLLEHRWERAASAVPRWLGPLRRMAVWFFLGSEMLRPLYPKYRGARAPRFRDPDLQRVAAVRCDFHLLRSAMSFSLAAMISFALRFTSGCRAILGCVPRCCADGFGVRLNR